MDANGARQLDLFGESWGRPMSSRGYDDDDVDVPGTLSLN